jgi:hypothetical protein
MLKAATYFFVLKSHLQGKGDYGRSKIPVNNGAYRTTGIVKLIFLYEMLHVSACNIIIRRHCINFIACRRPSFCTFAPVDDLGRNM